MEMLDKVIYKICDWIDNQFKKVEDLFTMDFTNFSKRNKKKCKCGKK
tara:strand:+ start:233 stop:373 length:141 start_codon:yes stop_codon:yes gene_type:complete